MRTNKFDSHLKKKYHHAHNKVFHLIITHGIFVCDFAILNGGKKSYANYCAISAIEINGKTSNLVLDSSCAHFAKHY